MVVPHSDEKKLQNITSVPYGDLRIEFRSQVVELRKRLVNNVLTKKIFNENINGEFLAKMLTQWISDINEGVIPNMEN